MILEVKNLSKTFKQGEDIIKALHDISFSLEAGKSLALTGPSGSGKTTILTLLAGLDSVNSGSITVDGTLMSALSEKQLALFRSRTVGIVFQQFHLMPNLTAQENVSLPLEILSSPNAEEQTIEMLKAVGLSDRKNHLPHQLSGGERQRVAIARASVMRPKVLLADEPSGNLDTETGKKVMDLLFNMTKTSGTSLVLVTHDLELAKRCDYQLHMLGGQLDQRFVNTHSGISIETV